jgi:NAD(P) transhydrogenase subunit alpha
MVASMKPGSVIVDLSGNAGGNCELTEPGRRIVAHGVTIDAPLNLPATMPFHASQLFSRNLVTYVTHLLRNGLSVDAAGTVQVSLDDEIVGSTCITHDGQVVHRATLERLRAETVGEGVDG